MTSIKQTLETARWLIAQPEQWKKGEFGWNKAHEQPVDPWLSMADCWCIRGAIYAAAYRNKPIPGRSGWLHKDASDAMQHVENMLQKYTSWPSSLLANWNDNSQTTHNDVIGLLDRAIAEAPDD